MIDNHLPTLTMALSDPFTFEQAHSQAPKYVVFKPVLSWNAAEENLKSFVVQEAIGTDSSEWNNVTRFGRYKLVDWQPLSPLALAGVNYRGVIEDLAGNQVTVVAVPSQSNCSC
ncbi:hypothetical protein LP420_39785 [Massilia sp. B-10]|nr:hypothetical protein LP420_39785 [Massilia sp. B-10]